MFMRFTATVVLIISCIAVFILQNIFGWFTDLFSLTPNIALNGAYWQFFTYMFLHASPLHLFLNMFVLLIFGTTVETVLGWKKYLFLYLISGIGSGIFYIALTGPSDILMLGASGATFGILTAYAFKFPKNWVIMFPGIPMPAAFIVIFFAGLELFLGFFDFQPGIAHWGHLGGIITGTIIMLYLRYKEKREPIDIDQDFEFIWQ